MLTVRMIVGQLPVCKAVGMSMSSAMLDSTSAHIANMARAGQKILTAAEGLLKEAATRNQHMSAIDFVVSPDMHLLCSTFCH